MSQKEKTGLLLVLVSLWGLAAYIIKPLTTTNIGLYLALALFVFGAVLFMMRD